MKIDYATGASVGLLALTQIESIEEEGERQAPEASSVAEPEDSKDEEPENEGLLSNTLEIRIQETINKKQ